MDTDPRWHFWIDRGGTFTDIVARRPDGTLTIRKLLSENPEQYDDAALAGMRALLGLAGDATFPESEVAVVKMGTTVATNALLERKGEPVVLLTTRGFGDALRIGYQNRPKLFSLRIERPSSLYDRVIEIDERVHANGTVETPLDAAAVEACLREAYADGFRSVAINFMHGYRYPAHEQQAAACAQRIGFTQISAGHRVSPLMKFVARGDTTVADAYLSPVLRRYVSRVRDAVGATRLMFMQSGGGLADARTFEGKDAILSGPAGGVVGAARIAGAAGFGRIIGFDMGGTSTDVSHYDGGFERSLENEIAGIRIRVPMLHIHTVAAGGGSVLHFDGQRFRVGPDSAGADPGPAAYRRGGPLTVTDCNLLLGKIPVDYFPKVFGPGADQAPDPDVVRERFRQLTAEINAAAGTDKTMEQVADGFIAVAVENMVHAIKQISIQRGHDVADYALVCFGGAGGQHACLVADALGIERVLIHPLAGVLSALGMGLADAAAHREQSVEKVLVDELVPEIDARFASLEQEALQELADGGGDPGAAVIDRCVHLRYRGSDTTLDVPLGTIAAMREGFEAVHRRRFGFIEQGTPVIAAAVALQAVVREHDPGSAVDLEKKSAGPVPVLEQGRFFSQDAWHDAPIVDRTALGAGDVIDGPAVIIEGHGTNIVEPGWRAGCTSRGDLLLSRRSPRCTEAVATAVDPVRLEIFNSLFMSVAEEMGVVLRHTAHSVNMKERLDFSCAVFDQEGQLIANAPHVPVHLGSMSESVRAIITLNRDHLRPGDVYALNAPYNGGTHLPDITVITPVFGERSGAPLFYVASRGHHADIGGITPGSVPPLSRSVEEEGVLIDNFLLVSGGRFREKETRALLTAGSYPARAPDQNIADLKAQIAANEKGAAGLKSLVAQFGLDVVRAYMQHVRDNAEESVRRVIGVLRDGEFKSTLDSGEVIAVKISIDHGNRGAKIDFTGTASQSDSNFNAPLAVCIAAMLYAFRCLVDDDIPLNAGCLKPLELVVPEGCLLNPRYPAAVVAGNVETSQVIVDTLFGALGVLAASQGTMNNFTFGNEQHQYYETLCGGAGAGRDFDGASAVQVHMTNSRLTDPEVLEWRYPVLVESFNIRRGSGGGGKHHGGDGLVRRIRFLQPMTAAIVSNRRQTDPFGLAGGSAGARGVNRIERRNGVTEILPASAEAAMGPGDIFIIETPGGGGFGKPG